MKFRSRTQINRAGRETVAISIGLFLLSICVAAAVLSWLTRNGAKRPASDTYGFTKPPSEIPAIVTWHHINEFPAAIAQMESVFWEPDDTNSLRAWLEQSDRLKNSDVLEIGCGTGLVSIACALHGARNVVASDINPAAVVNATYNAELCGVTQRLVVRQVNEAHPGPFEVIGADEKFDFILSNPPWEDEPVESKAAYAFYDPGFKLLEGILTESKRHLKPGGRVLLAYGAKRAINRVMELAESHDWNISVHDDRQLDSLPEVFLPGMLLELTSIEPRAKTSASKIEDTYGRLSKNVLE